MNILKSSGYFNPKIKLFTPAKINLGLKINNVLPDGYHRLETFFQTISLYDHIVFEKTRNPGIEIKIRNGPEIENNIITKAYMEMCGDFNITGGLKVTLRKNIPLQAGLGGGSSNAAATLLAIIKLWNLDVSNDEMINIGVRIGADVPFFLHSEASAIAGGVGEELFFQDPLFSGYLVLVKPPVNINTAAAFKKWDEKNRDSVFFTYAEIRNNQDFSELSNDFEKIICEFFPNFNDYMDFFKVENAIYAGLSGSGSAVFGLFPDKTSAEHAKNNLHLPGRAFLLTTPVQSLTEQLGGRNNVY